jgi:hypothetical protein
MNSTDLNQRRPVVRCDIITSVTVSTQQFIALTCLIFTTTCFGQLATNLRCNIMNWTVWHTDFLKIKIINKIINFQSNRTFNARCCTYKDVTHTGAFHPAVDPLYPSLPTPHHTRHPLMHPHPQDSSQPAGEYHFRIPPNGIKSILST